MRVTATKNKLTKGKLRNCGAFVTILMQFGASKLDNYCSMCQVLGVLYLILNIVNKLQNVAFQYMSLELNISKLVQSTS